MTTSLAHTLASSIPRETSGSRSSNRFDFQKDWAICELLRLHLSESDYLLILDYHEDVVVLDSEDKPQKVKFYQLKSSKAANWSIPKLCSKSSKNDGNSILKKLYSGYLLCPDETINLVFISNQSLKAKLKNDDNSINYDSVSFAQFTDKDKSKIHESIEGQNSETCNFHRLNLISIKRTDLPVNNHDIFTKGQLVNFFNTLDHKKIFSVELAYKTLFDEVKRKNNIEIVCSNFNDLKNNKGIGHRDFQRILNAFISYTSNSNCWEEASNQLRTDGYDFSTIRKIKTAWSKYSIEIVNSFDDDLLTARGKIRLEIRDFEQYNSTYTLKQLIDGVKQKVEFNKIPTLANEPYIEEASIIYEVMVSEPIQKVNSEYKEETV